MSNTARIRHYLVVYDIGADSERRQVEKILLGWGERLQKSVFKVVTTPLGAKQLERALRQTKLDSGNIQMHRLLVPTQVIALGKIVESPQDKIAFFI